MTDEILMRRCIELARQGSGNVAPNPMVGCLIVYDGRIIGEGFHQKFGGPHAEVNAIASVEEKNQHLISSSSLYVNLEPCSHYGKTPPCTDLIIQKKIKNIFIGCEDTNPFVVGNGIEKLKEAGCNVKLRIMYEESRKLNKRFFTFIERQRPYVILKWAETVNGFIAPADKVRTHISNDYSRMLVHQWRAEEAAVLVGTETASYDDPQLDARNWNGAKPIRVVLDRTLRLSPHLKLFDRSAPTIVFTEITRQSGENIEFVKINFNEGLVDDILASLYQRQIQSVMVEGGARLLQSFIENGHWDEARIFIAPKMLQDGLQAPRIIGSVISKEFILDDELILLGNNA